MARVGEEYSPLTQQDQLISKVECPSPVRGVYDGIDPALPDFIFHVG